MRAKACNRIRINALFARAARIVSGFKAAQAFARKGYVAAQKSFVRASPRKMHTPHYPPRPYVYTHTAHAARTSLCILKSYNPSPKIEFRLFSCTHHPHHPIFLFGWEIKPLLLSSFLPWSIVVKVSIKKGYEHRTTGNLEKKEKKKVNLESQPLSIKAQDPLHASSYLLLPNVIHHRRECLIEQEMYLMVQRSLGHRLTSRRFYVMRFSNVRVGLSKSRISCRILHSTSIALIINC